MEPPVRDRRVDKTQRLLRDALVSLIHEKSYDTIVVQEILERANVGRSTFYAHFEDKDALLVNGIRQMLRATTPRSLPSSMGRLETIVRFSLPVFEYIHTCRHSGHVGMPAHGRAVVHQHLREVLIEEVEKSVADARLLDLERGGAPSELIVTYVVDTFVMVLNWWVDGGRPLSPRHVDDLFLRLVTPALIGFAK